MFFDIQFGKTPVDIARAKGYTEVLTVLSSDQVSWDWKIPKLVHHSCELIEMKIFLNS